MDNIVFEDMRVSTYTFVPVSPYADYETLVLLGRGTNGSTSIVDSSTVANKTGLISSIGSTTISNDTAQYGSTSIKFNGSGLNVSNAEFAHFTGDFTIETWYYQTVDQGLRVLFGAAGGSGNFQIQFNQDGNVGRTGIYDNSSWKTLDLPSPLNTWFHLAYSRTGSTTTIFYNGVSQGTISVASSLYFSQGGTGAGIGYLGGYGQTSTNTYLQQFRVIKGLGIYTSNFTPSDISVYYP